MGIIYAIITALSSTGMYVFTKLLVDKQKHPIVNSGLFQIIAGLFLLIPVFFVDVEAEISTRTAGLIILASLLYTGYNVAHFNSYKYLDISLIGILAQTSVIVGFAGSVILFSEEITAPKVIGTLFILAGNTYVLVKGRSEGKVSMKGVILKVLSSALMASAFMVDAYTSPLMTASLYGALVFIIPGIFTLIYAGQSPKTILKTFWLHEAAIVTTSFFGALGLYTLLKAYSMEEKSVVIPIVNTTTILVVLAGAVFFKERKLLGIKLLAAILSITGVIILGLY